MEEFGLNDLCKRLEEEIPLLKEQMSITAKCWRCKEGKNKGKLVSPCKCIKQFIHVHCLEISANTQNVLHCPFCHAPYPLDIRHKSLLECYRDNTLPQMFREIYCPFLKILAFLFCYLFVGSMIFYIMELFDFTSIIRTMFIKDNVIIPITMFMFMVCVYTFNLLKVVVLDPLVFKWIDKIYNIYRKNTQEIKLKKEYPYIGII